MDDDEGEYESDYDEYDQPRVGYLGGRDAVLARYQGALEPAGGPPANFLSQPPAVAFGAPAANRPFRTFEDFRPRNRSWDSDSDSDASENSWQRDGKRAEDEEPEVSVSVEQNLAFGAAPPPSSDRPTPASRFPSAGRRGGRPSAGPAASGGPGAAEMPVANLSRLFSGPSPAGGAADVDAGAEVDAAGVGESSGRRGWRAEDAAASDRLWAEDAAPQEGPRYRRRSKEPQQQQQPQRMQPALDLQLQQKPAQVAPAHANTVTPLPGRVPRAWAGAAAQRQRQEEQPTATAAAAAAHQPPQQPRGVPPGRPRAQGRGPPNNPPQPVQQGDGFRPFALPGRPTQAPAAIAAAPRTGEAAAPAARSTPRTGQSGRGTHTPTHFWGRNAVRQGYSIRMPEEQTGDSSAPLAQRLGRLRSSFGGAEAEDPRALQAGPAPDGGGRGAAAAGRRLSEGMRPGRRSVGGDDWEDIDEAPGGGGGGAEQGGEQQRDEEGGTGQTPGGQLLLRPRGPDGGGGAWFGGGAGGIHAGPGGTAAEQPTQQPMPQAPGAIGFLRRLPRPSSPAKGETAVRLAAQRELAAGAKRGKGAGALSQRLSVLSAEDRAKRSAFERAAGDQALEGALALRVLRSVRQAHLLMLECEAEQPAPAVEGAAAEPARGEAGGGGDGAGGSALWLLVNTKEMAENLRTEPGCRLRVRWPWSEVCVPVAGGCRAVLASWNVTQG